MDISSTLKRAHVKAKQNRWLHRFTVSTRIAPAAGFLSFGSVIIPGERFILLSADLPMTPERIPAWACGKEFCPNKLKFEFLN